MQYGLQSSSLHYRALYTAQFAIFLERLVRVSQTVKKNSDGEIHRPMRCVYDVRIVFFFLIFRYDGKDFQTWLSRCIENTMTPFTPHSSIPSLS